MSKEKQAAASEVANIWGAENASIGTLSTADTDRGSRKALTLTLENIKNVDDNYPKENITSISAFSFFNNLPPDEYKDFDDIKITLKNKSNTFEKNYKVTDLIVAKEIKKSIDDFSNQIISGDLNNFENLFDLSYVKDTTLVKIKNVIKEIENGYGRPNESLIYKIFFGNSEETRDPIVIFYLKISNAKGYAEYKLTFETVNKKIIDFAYNT
jgi:hypothetical protein